MSQQPNIPRVADAPMMGGSEARELFAAGFTVSYQPEFT